MTQKSLRDKEYAKKALNKPIQFVSPNYPRRANLRGKEGYAIVAYTITRSGEVTNIRLMKENPEGWGFGREAIKAASKLKFRPREIETEDRREYTFSMAK